MALQSTTFFDVANQTQTLTYTLNSTQIDQISYANNQITYSNSLGFNLIKSDAILYASYLSVYLNTLIANFPNIRNSSGISLPVSSFEIQLVSSPITHIYYTQYSQGNLIYNTNYVPIASSASFAARSTVIVTIQEFLLSVQFKQLFINQISFN